MMSKLKHMVELTPPDYLSTEQRLTSHGMECGYCHWRGTFVTDWAGAASEGSPFKEEALAVFDLPDKIHRRLANLEGETFGELDLAQSITNHNHEDIVETIEVYQYVAIKRL